MQNESARTKAGNLQDAEPLRPEEGLREAHRRLRLTFRPGELIWLLNEQHNVGAQAWNIDIVRQGAAGRWMQQRYRFDEQAQVLYFLGETALTDVEFRHARTNARIFPAAGA